MENYGNDNDVAQEGGGARATETISPHYQGLDTWPFQDVIAAIVESNLKALELLKSSSLTSLAEAAQGVAENLKSGGRLVYVGAGTSGRLALQDATELWPTFSFDRIITLMAGGPAASEKAVEAAEDDIEAAKTEILAHDIASPDALIALAASGATPYTLAALKLARARGVFTVAMANNPQAPLLAEADIGIYLPSQAEVLAGSTRLSAGTVQKVALNALSTSVLVHLGGAYDNLMVAMRPSNQKLFKRASYIVSQAAQVSEMEARAMLEKSHWQIREAIVMLKTGLSLEAAQAKLAQHHYRVREAIG
ncbi:MAG: N-acetylmuramic acid 6-phosphate etherase [Deinococcales bacterium]